MKIQLAWLRELIALPESAAEVGRRLTSLGFALDGIEGEGEGEGDAAVLDLDIGSNRPDALSHLGIARELAAALGRPLTIPSSHVREAGERTDAAAKVIVEAPDLCPRYAARVVRGVTIGPSPAWLAARLSACGIRPINVVVDVTNLVLLELGHPLHAFDLDTLRDRTVVVRRARAGETLTTLDGQERPLDPEMLLIADAHRGIALAGVMGGADSEIRDTTRDVLIESAVFLPSSVRRTARALGLHTEASHRFERGCDREMAGKAVDRAASLLAELASGTVLAGVIDVAAPAAPPREVTMRLQRARDLTGVDVPEADVRRILEGLGFDITAHDADSVTVRVPSWRGDVSREVDLIEELLRHHGFDAVPYALPAFRSGAQARQPWELGIQRVRAALVASGCLQAVHWAFDDPADQLRWAPLLVPDAAERLVELSNPMAENIAVMRVSLVPALLRTLAAALRRGEEDVRLFEDGRSYLARPTEAGDDATPAEERLVLALVAAGAASPRHFLHAPRPVDVLTLKGALLEALVAGGALPADLVVVACEVPGCAPGAAELRLRGRRIGWLGRIHPDLLGSLEVVAPVHAAEVDLTDVVANGPRPRGYEAPSRYPKIVRDLCVLVDRTRPLGDILNAVTAFRASQEHGGDLDLIESVELIDRYVGAGVPDAQVSLTFSVIWRGADRTLTQDEVDARHAALLGVLEREVGAVLRS